jgi:hypothetical protein
VKADRPLLILIASLDDARPAAELVGMPVAHGHLYLRSHRFVFGAGPCRVSSLPKVYLFPQFRQRDRVLIHGIPSTPTRDGTIGDNDGRILRFIWSKEGTINKEPGQRLGPKTVPGIGGDGAAAVTTSVK